MDNIYTESYTMAPEINTIRMIPGFNNKRTDSKTDTGLFAAYTTSRYESDKQLIVSLTCKSGNELNLYSTSSAIPRLTLSYDADKFVFIGIRQIYKKFEKESEKSEKNLEKTDNYTEICILHKENYKKKYNRDISNISWTLEFEEYAVCEFLEPISIPYNKIHCYSDHGHGYIIPIANRNNNIIFFVDTCKKTSKNKNYYKFVDQKFIGLTTDKIHPEKHKTEVPYISPDKIITKSDHQTATFCKIH